MEVISDCTEAFDRGDKFADYQILESLQEYVLMNSKRQRVECFRRGDDGLWIWKFYTEDKNVFQLKSINFEGSLTNLYKGVSWELPSEI